MTTYIVEAVFVGGWEVWARVDAEYKFFGLFYSESSARRWAEENIR